MPRYVGWLNDPLVVRYSEQRHNTHTLATCEAYWRSFAGTPSLLWAIVVPGGVSGDETNALCHIGNISASIDMVNSVADVGIMIGERSVWNQGYGVEAWKAVCRHLLCDRGLRKISAGTLSVNTAMLGIMRRSGMLEDGRRTGQFLFEGQAVDVVYAALFADKYQLADQ